MTNYKRNHILYVTTLLLLFVTLLSVIGITIFVLLQFSGSIVTFTLLQFSQTMRYSFKKIYKILRKFY